MIAPIPAIGPVTIIPIGGAIVQAKVDPAIVEVGV